MKTVFFFSGIILSLLACSGQKNKDESMSQDSTQHIQDTSVTQPDEEKSSPSMQDAQVFTGETNNFPRYSMEVFTNDSLERELNRRMVELLLVYDTISFATITASYYWERPYFVPGQDGPGQMSTETTEGKRTWFFDRSSQLRGYSMTMNSSGNETTKSILYLFANDSLVAVREQQEYSGDGGFTENVTILASQCPRCGLVATDEGSAEVKEYIDKKGLLTKQQAFYESMTELISLLKAERKNAKGDDYNFLFSIKHKEEGGIEGRSKAIDYIEEFTVAKELYVTYISKQ